MRNMVFLCSLALLLFHSGPSGAEPAEAIAEEVGKQAIAIAADHFDVAEGRIAVVAIEPRTWSDSSLGCPKPGRRYLPSTKEGYLVTVAHGSEQYSVHLADGRGLVCEGVLREGP